MGRRRKNSGSDLSGLFAIVRFLITAIFSLINFLCDIFARKKETEHPRTVENPPPSFTQRETFKADRGQETYAQTDKYRPPTRKHAKPEIDKFLDVKRKTRIIIFDVETNGLNGENSVLSCSAIKYEIDPNDYEMAEIERFNRYYYPVEQLDPQAIAVNGLTKEVITEKRGAGTYPEHFNIDSDFENFCGDTTNFVAHNISFDLQFIPFMRQKKKFCTMMNNTDIVAVYFLEWKSEWKWPKLSETAVHYGIQFNESDLHSSMADAETTAKIFMRMLDAVKTDGNGVAAEIDDSLPHFHSRYNFTWQLKNVNESLVSKCSVGDVLFLIREGKAESANYLGVATKSGEYLGKIDSSDLKDYGLIFDIDHGAEVSVRIKQIFTKSGKF